MVVHPRVPVLHLVLFVTSWQSVCSSHHIERKTCIIEFCKTFDF